MFEPPKNGTTTARKFLKSVGWYLNKPEHDYPETSLEKYPNLADYKYYVFIRNPLDRFVSAVLHLKREHPSANKMKELIAEAGLSETPESISYEQIIDIFPKFDSTYVKMFDPQSRWATLPGTEILDFDNYETEIRRVSDNYTAPLVIQNEGTDFGKSVVTQKVIDFVRQHYAADYALAKDRLGKEY